MKNCTCHICTTSVADLITEVFVSYLIGNISIDKYAEITEWLKKSAQKQIRDNNIKTTICNETYTF